MIGHYAAQFEREQGCTEAEWLAWWPGAVREHPFTLAPGHAVVRIGDGRLDVRWQVLPPRQIALVRLPRMAIAFRFDDAVDEAARQRFMRYFDLYMQRGGG